MRLHDRTTLLPWDPVAFSPFVNDPVALYLSAVHRGTVPAPFGHVVFSARDLAIELEKDPASWDWLGQKLSQMREVLGADLVKRNEEARNIAGFKLRNLGKILTASSKQFQTGGYVPEAYDDPAVPPTLPGTKRVETRDRYWLRIPESTQALESALDRVLEAGVGFPPVALQVRHGKSYPVWLLGDATELYAKAWEKKTASRSGPGRPHGPWRLAYEIEREGTGCQWSK